MWRCLHHTMMATLSLGTMDSAYSSEPSSWCVKIISHAALLYICPRASKQPTNRMLQSQVVDGPDQHAAEGGRYTCTDEEPRTEQTCSQIFANTCSCWEVLLLLCVLPMYHQPTTDFTLLHQYPARRDLTLYVDHSFSLSPPPVAILHSTPTFNPTYITASSTKSLYSTALSNRFPFPTTEPAA